MKEQTNRGLSPQIHILNKKEGTQWSSLSQAPVISSITPETVISCVPPPSETKENFHTLGYGNYRSLVMSKIFWQSIQWCFISDLAKELSKPLELSVDGELVEHLVLWDMKVVWIKSEKDDQEKRESDFMIQNCTLCWSCSQRRRGLCFDLLWFIAHPSVAPCLGDLPAPLAC